MMNNLEFPNFATLFFARLIEAGTHSVSCFRHGQVLLQVPSVSLASKPHAFLTVARRNTCVIDPISSTIFVRFAIGPFSWAQSYCLALLYVVDSFSM